MLSVCVLGRLHRASRDAAKTHHCLWVCNEEVWHSPSGDAAHHMLSVSPYRASLTQLRPSGCVVDTWRKDRAIGVVVGSAHVTKEVGCCLGIPIHAWNCVCAGIDVQQALVL